MMRFECCREWNALPHNSNALFGSAKKKSVFISREWFESLTKHMLTNERELLLACVVDTADIADDFTENFNYNPDNKDDSEGNRQENNQQEDKVLAILPLLTHENKEWTSLCHSYSSLYSVLSEDEQRQEILNCLSQGLKDLPFEYLTFSPIAEDDEKLQSLQRSMEKSGIACYRNFHSYNWFHKTNGQSFAEYLSERPTKVRNTIARKHRKLEREHHSEIRLFFGINEDIQKALADYHAIYKRSWKANEQYQSLVEDVIQQFSKRAWPRLAILTVDGKPIAAQLWFVVEGKASIFRLVYDESWKQYSPGSILMSYLLEHVIDTDKVTEIDFLSGNDAYKKDWMSERRERFALVCVKKEKVETVQAQSLFSKIRQALIK